MELDIVKLVAPAATGRVVAPLPRVSPPPLKPLTVPPTEYVWVWVWGWGWVWGCVELPWLELQPEARSRKPSAQESVSAPSGELR
jgi:hypothetical protein